MAQHVRMDMLRDALARRPACHATLHCASAQGTTAPVYEHGVLVCGRKLRALAQPRLQRCAGESAHRNNARLFSLPQHAYRVAGKTDVL